MFVSLYMAGEACGQDFTGTIFGAQERWLGDQQGKQTIILVNKLSIGQENNQLGNKTINRAKKQSIMQTNNQLGNKTTVS